MKPYKVTQKDHSISSSSLVSNTSKNSGAGKNPYRRLESDIFNLNDKNVASTFEAQNLKRLLLRHLKEAEELNKVLQGRCNSLDKVIAIFDK